jgi:hypothetical protein
LKRAEKKSSTISECTYGSKSKKHKRGSEVEAKGIHKASRRRVKEEELFIENF